MNNYPHRQCLVPTRERSKWRIRLAEVGLTLVLAGTLVALTMMYFDVVRV